MSKKILDFFIKHPKDALNEQIEKEPIVKKQFAQLGIALGSVIVVLLLTLLSIFLSDKTMAPLAYKVDLKEMTQEEINIMPFPHQSLKNVSGWLQDAAAAAYSFDFLNYDAQVRRASYYFTDLGYQTYLTALTANKVRDSVVGSRLQISLVPLQDPILINSGFFGSTDFWRFKMPVLVSYYGGSKPIIEKVMIEMLVLRVPAHKNHKGLSIAEFNMSPAD